MRAFFNKYGFAIFWLISLADFVLIYLDANTARYFTKPLLMPILICTLFSKVELIGRTTSKFIIAVALIAATAGDIFLLNNGGFTAGLICFLIVLLLYTIYFLSIQSISTKQIVSLVMFAAVFISGFSLLIAVLWNYLDGFKIPLIVYSFFLIALIVSAINIFFNAETKLIAIDTFIPGAIFFVISDVMLATNKFYFEEPFLNIAVMATYCGAQYYICRGCVKEFSRIIISTKNEMQQDFSSAHQQFNLN